MTAYDDYPGGPTIPPGGAHSAKPSRIPEMAQHGWNEGYIAGEAERITLATANCDLRTDLRDLQAERVWLWRIAELLGSALLARGVRPDDCDALDEWMAH